jgi:hypothetical protein
VTYVEDHRKAGVEAHRKGFPERALEHYAAVLKYDPENVETLSNISGILAESGKHMAAIACARKAFTLEPENAYYVANLGNVLIRMEHYEAGAEALKHAIDLKPDEAMFYNWLGLALWPTDMKMAEKCILRSLSMDGSQRNVGHALALTRLALRDWKRGFVGLAAYSPPPEAPYIHSMDSPWNGQDIANKTLLVYGDQGFGDVMQFCRFYSDLPCKKVILSVQRPLVRLLAVSGVADEVVCLDDPAPDSDYQVIMMWGLKHLNIAEQLEPKFIPYLRSNDLWTDPYAREDTLLRIGICWAGSSAFKNNANRTMTFDHFLSLADIPGIRLQSLQYGESGEDIRKAGALGLVSELPVSVYDMASMLPVIKSCDVVLSVDTGVLHLAGGSGTDVIGLIPYNPCWRWARGYEDSPFYPSLRLVRQASPGDWIDVMNKVRTLISERLENLPSRDAGSFNGGNTT